ncbi:MAG: hemerythrin domain-containing protein [Burkholderiaceae bacterium]
MATKKTAAKKSATTKSSERDAVDVLKADHKEVKALFKQYKSLVESEEIGEERQAVAQQICLLLTVHATAEEEILYPAARAAIDDSDLLDEAEVEHASAKDLIAQIESMNPEDALYDAKVIVLGEYIDHHVEEEEGEMFPKCRKSDMDLVALGEAIEARKAKLMEEMDAVA